MSSYIEAGICAMLLLFSGCASAKEEQTMPLPDVTFSSKEEELEQFLVATGDKLERLCTMLSKPMHCPAPGIFDKENAILIERLPKLPQEDRKIVLAAIPFTINTKEAAQRTLPVLEQLWKTANNLERNDLVRPLVKSMMSKESMFTARSIFEHLGGEVSSGFQDFQAVLWLLKRHEPEKEVATALQKRLIREIKNGKVQAKNLEDALKVATQIKTDDPQIELMYRVVTQRAPAGLMLNTEEKIIAINKLSATTPNQGVAFAFLIMCSNENEEVNDLAHAALERITTALGMKLDADVFYLDALRQKGTRNWPGEQNPERESAICYFKAEARRDAKLATKRLNDKGVIFSDKELKLFRAYEIPSIFIDALKH